MTLRHHGARVCMTFFTALVVICAEAGLAPASEDLARALRQRYRVSRIEAQNAALTGVVARQGTRFRLQTGGLSAKPFRVAQANTKSPRFHVHDYAGVEIVSGRAVTIEPGEFQLPMGTELALLALEVRPEAIHLFTHTTQPLPGPSGRPVYGCTEFIFRFDEASLRSPNVSLVEQVIERWLSPLS